jgi:hypothetical protein
VAHYAIIRDGIVEQVITGVDETVTQTDTDGTVIEASTEAWEAFYAAQPWWNGATVRRCSYNGNFRHNYPGPGWTWDEDADAFYAPQPFPSWTLDDDYRWVAPVPYPEDGGPYLWNEEEQVWQLAE